MSDINQELILLYKTIQKDVHSLVEELKKIENEYLALNEEKRRIYFFNKRHIYNEFKNRIDIKPYTIQDILRGNHSQDIIINID